MGFLADARYFVSSLSPETAWRLTLRKLEKRERKRRLARLLAANEPDPAFFARMGLPENKAERLHVLQDAWTPLASSTVLRPHISTLAADRVLSGFQDLFGREQQVGWPPRWGWRWDGTENEALFARDVRSTWELQRLQGILPLAAAANASVGGERERYAAAYLEALESFHHQHPGPHGIAWSSALELGLRLIALAQGLPLVLESQAFGERDRVILRGLDRHARWLGADLSLDKVVCGNHLLGELAGLLVAGHLLPSARNAWWGDVPVRSLLESEILRQFHEDGVSVEQSLPYEKFILEFLTVAGELARLRGEPFAPAVRERLSKVADHLTATTAPDGELPRIGDCDSGRGAFDAQDPRRPQAAVARARDVFGSGNTTPTHFFERGGHVVLAPTAGDFLFVRGGPFGWGVPGPAAHSHADWLSPVLYLDGEPVLIDPGVFGYDIGHDLRDAFRTWEAHNAIAPGPQHGPRPSGLFRWTRWNARCVIQTSENAVEGRVTWTGGEPLLWHRSIGYNQLRRGWRIEDRLEGAPSYPIRASLHFAPEAEVTKGGGIGELGIRLRSGRVLSLRFQPPADPEVGRGWVAPSYGRRDTGLVLTYVIPSNVAMAVDIHRVR